MRSILIVLGQPLGTASLLASQSLRRSSGHFGFLNPMKLFMGSVFIGPTRRDKLHFDPQLDPPRTQARQPRGTAASKRSAVVAANPLRKSLSPEDFYKGCF